jgi:UDP-4-amino-4,6-dideoxy-N-acetyl-beta-L-altrosamine transaminase
MIQYGRQEITQADIDAVVDVLRSDFLTQGPQVPYFESKLSAYCGASHVLAMNSATSALHVACLALGLSAGDWLWTTPTTFVASANCALYCGANVDFVDIDADTWNISTRKLEDKLIVAEREGKLPKIVVPVHLCGRPCDMKAIHALGQRFGFRIIEDASHAIGARYRNEPVGNCRYSDITIFSFHPVKIITTGEGGAALTNHKSLAEKMDLLRSHGITRTPEKMSKLPDGPWYYEQIDLGFNYRMTEMQAALGVSQMDRLDDFVARRHEIAARYDELLSELPLRLPALSENYSGLHLYVVRIKLDETPSSHREIFTVMRGHGIAVNLHYIPVHTQPYYRKMGFAVGDFPESESYYREAISLPMYANLTKEDQLKVVSAIKIALFA